jgi:acyl carrier protein
MNKNTKELSPEELCELSLKLKLMLIQECNVKNCTPDDIGDHDPLIGGSGKLQLDSLDAVEIVSALERTYAIRLDNPGEARKVLETFASMREYVIQKR